MKYIIVTKNSFKKGFITHEDQEKNELKFKYFPIDTPLTAVSGTDNKISVWIKRVRGKEITVTKAKTLLKAYNEQGKTNRLAELAKEKTEIENRVFNFAELMK